MSLLTFKLKSARRLLWSAAMFLLLFNSAFAQSVELNSPTPVLSNEIAGRIAPLDIGDARSTRFFYTFNGQQGDLELTVESNNLDGEIDIYLANSMRPLTKVTLFAGTSGSRIAKTVYIRRDAPLILRVQARTPNDAEGAYRIRFGGTFRPANRLAGDSVSTDETAAANPLPAPTPAGSAGRKVQRVTSTGARIEEPVAEIAVKEDSEKTEVPPASPPVAEKKATPKPRPARTRAATRGTSRRNVSRTTTSNDAEKAEGAKPEEGKNETQVAETNTPGESTPAETSTASKSKPARPIRIPRAPRNRNSSTTKKTGTPPSPTDAATTSPVETNAPPASGPRLVLIMRDGEKLERDMSSIRRVTVENGMIVIVPKNGKTERQAMTSVLRMSIEP